VKRGTIEHPKLRHLCSLLNLERFAAVGILESLWHFTAKYTPQGDIGKFPNEEIARGVGWSRRSGRAGVSSGSCLVEALVTSGWLDRSDEHRLIVHDWADHADQQVTRLLARRKLAFVKPKLAVPLPLPLPKPYPLPQNGEVVDGAKKRALENPLLDLVAEEIHARHPVHRRNCSAAAVRARLRAILRKVPKAEWEEKLNRINDNHRGWCESQSWRKEDGEYVKALENWLAPTKGRFYQEPPPSSLPASSQPPRGLLI
jgi:hypothetical protein